MFALKLLWFGWNYAGAFVDVLVFLTSFLLNVQWCTDLKCWLRSYKTSQTVVNLHMIDGCLFFNSHIITIMPFVLCTNQTHTQTPKNVYLICLIILMLRVVRLGKLVMCRVENLPPNTSFIIASVSSFLGSSRLENSLW